MLVTGFSSSGKSLDTYRYYESMSLILSSPVATFRYCSNQTVKVHHMKFRKDIAFALAFVAVSIVFSSVMALLLELSDRTKLPLGDGKFSSSPKMGYVFSCNTRFRPGGAFKDGAWIKSDGTFDATQKAVVDGNVIWKNAKLEMTLDKNSLKITGNDLPNHSTGTFPISASDDAFAYDRNPNAIAVQMLEFRLPANTKLATLASCVGMGAIGALLSGSLLFNALDEGGRDAVAHETQDACEGHPEQRGAYHYHNVSSCVLKQTGESGLVGYALDGFGIFGPREAGKLLTNSDLDECHGHNSEVLWNGKKVEMYHYHATLEFPYTIGCFKGTPIVTRGR